MSRWHRCGERRLSAVRGGGRGGTGPALAACRSHRFLPSLEIRPAPTVDRDAEREPFTFGEIMLRQPADIRVVMAFCRYHRSPVGVDRRCNGQRCELLCRHRIRGYDFVSVQRVRHERYCVEPMSPTRGTKPFRHVGERQASGSFGVHPLGGEHGSSHHAPRPARGRATRPLPRRAPRSLSRPWF